MLLRSFITILVVPLLSQAFQAETESPLVLRSEPGWQTPAFDIDPLTFSDGRMLVTVQNKLYMISQDGQVAWTYSPNVPISAQPVFRPDRNEIGLVGLDLTFVRLDAATGKEIWRARANGRANFADLKPYRDGYVVLTDRAGYRDSGNPELPDRLSYWGVANDTWSVDFPRGARLAVAGDRIYAIRFGDDVVVQEIRPLEGTR
jgi:outer membrane protein assembly factor BamB